MFVMLKSYDQARFVYSNELSVAYLDVWQNESYWQKEV